MGSGIYQIILCLFVIIASGFTNNLQAQGLSDQQKSQIDAYQKSANEAIQTDNLPTASGYINKIARIYWEVGSFQNALNSYKQSVELNKRIGNRNALENLYNNIGMIYLDLSQSGQAISAFSNSLTYSKQLGHQRMELSNYMGLAEAYKMQENNQQVINYLTLALDIATSISDKTFMRSCYSQLAEAHQKAGNSEESYKYINMLSTIDKSIHRDELSMSESEKLASNELLREERDRRRLTQDSLTEVEYENKQKEKYISLLSREKEFIKKEKEFQEARNKEQEVKLSRERQIRYLLLGLFLVFTGFSVALFALFRQKKKANQLLAEQKQEIEVQANKLEHTNKQLEKLSLVASHTDNAVLIMDANGDFEWVNEGFTRIFGFTFDELTLRAKNIVGEQTPDYVREAVEICLTEKKTVQYEVQTPTKDGRKIWVHTTLTPIVGADHNISKLVAIDADIGKLKKVQEDLALEKEKVDRQNKHINDSIRYAQKIQQAILPLKNQVDKYLDSYILFRPREIVSGDFYWFTQLEVNGQEKLLVAVVDCTGHGVPGAFMSMIGHSLLSEIVKEKRIYQPEEVLTTLNTRVEAILQQKQTDRYDGMDVCLCLIEATQNKHIYVSYCGAKLPLFYIKQSDGKVNTIKATRKSIAGFSSERRRKLKFKAHRIGLQHGDMIYLCTDGLIDQNNADLQKYGRHRFIEEIEIHFKQSTQSQLSSLTNSLDQHQKEELQRDDITVWGIRL